MVIGNKGLFASLLFVMQEGAVTHVLKHKGWHSGYLCLLGAQDSGKLDTVRVVLFSQVFCRMLHLVV